MREIKFRAWLSGKMVSTDRAILEISLRGFHQTDSYVLMQYTGLKDKNGKEIYEGDVIRLTWMSAPYQGCDDDEREPAEDIGTMEFSSGCFHFNGKQLSVYTHFHYNNTDREIIGNIYENPELVK